VIPVLRTLPAWPVNTVFGAEIVILMKPAFRKVYFPVDDIKIVELGPPRYRYLPGRFIDSAGRARCIGIRRGDEYNGAGPRNLEVKMRPLIRLNDVMMRAAR
jgi:hypothetical protein